MVKVQRPNSELLVATAMARHGGGRPLGQLV